MSAPRLDTSPAASSAPCLDRPASATASGGLFDTLRRLAEGAWGPAIGAVWALGDSTFVSWPTPPAEALLAGLVLAAPREAWRLGRAVLVGTLLGASAMWGIGAAAPPLLRRDVTGLVPGVSDPAAVAAAVERHGAAALLRRAPFDEPPGALALEAGLRGASPLGVAAAALAARTARLLAVLGAAALLGGVRRPRRAPPPAGGADLGGPPSGA